MYIYQLSYFFNQITFLPKPNFFEDSDKIELKKELEDEIKSLLNRNIEDEYVALINQLNKNKYESCSDYLFLHGFNNLFSTIIFFIKFQKNMTIEFINEYFIDVDDIAVLLHEKMMQIKNLSLLDIFQNHQSFFLNIARLPKKNISYSKNKVNKFQDEEIKCCNNKYTMFNYYNHNKNLKDILGKLWI